MRFLLDENISPKLVGLLAVEGHDVVHLQDLGLKSAPDLKVLDAAAANSEPQDRARDAAEISDVA